MVSTEQKTMVLMDGLRHIPGYHVVLEVLENEQKESADAAELWGRVTKHLVTAAARVEHGTNEEQKAVNVVGMSAVVQPQQNHDHGQRRQREKGPERCRLFAHGKCRRGDRCKFAHGHTGTKQKKQITCGYCGKNGHAYKDCRLKARDDKGLASQVANLAQEVKAMLSQRDANQFSFVASEEPAWWESSRIFQMICLLTILFGVGAGVRLEWSLMLAVFAAMASVEIAHIFLKFLVGRRPRSAASVDEVFVDANPSILSLSPRELERFRNLRRVAKVAGKKTRSSGNQTKRCSRKHLKKSHVLSGPRPEGVRRFRFPRVKDNVYEFAFPATEDGRLFATCLALYAGGYVKLEGKDSTIFDSGATSSMFNQKKWFNADTLVPCHVKVGLANGESTFATHRGDAVVRSLDKSGAPTVVTLTDSLLVPSLEHNLISTQCLDKARCAISMSGGELCVLTRQGTQCLFGLLCAGLYHLIVRGPPARPSASLASTHTGGLSQPDLWHRRMGHASIKYLKNIVPSELLKAGLSYCDACVRAKATRRPYKHSKVPPTKVQAPLDVFAADMCGPFPTAFLHKFKYFLSVVDVATRFTFVVLARTKSEVADRLISFLNFVRHQVGCLPKRFHYDGGTEVNTNEVRAFMDANGVLFTTILPLHRPTRTLWRNVFIALFRNLPVRCWRKLGPLPSGSSKL